MSMLEPQDSTTAGPQRALEAKNKLSSPRELQKQILVFEFWQESCRTMPGNFRNKMTFITIFFPYYPLPHFDEMF